MCTPMAAMGGSSVMSLASGAMSAFGSLQQGKAQAGAANFNAQQALMQGQSVMNASRINEQQTYREGDQLEGQARAAMGANGVEMNSGSALQVQKDIGTRTGQNVADQDYNARLQQWGGVSTAALDQSQASNDTAAAGIAAGGTLLSGASQVSGKWAGFQQAGVLS